MRRMLICMLALIAALGTVFLAAGESSAAVKPEELYGADAFYEAWYDEVRSRILERAAGEDADEALNRFYLGSFDSGAFVTGVIYGAENDDVMMIFWADEGEDGMISGVPIGMGLSLKYTSYGVDCAGVQSIAALLDLAVSIYGGTEEEIAALKAVLNDDLEWDMGLPCDEWVDPVFVPFGSGIAKFRCFEDDGHIEVGISAQDQINRWGLLGIQYRIPEP